MTSKATQIKPGEVRNPHGRPSQALSKKEWMDKNVPNETMLAILQKAIDLALAGKPSMIELILTRILPPISTEDTIKIKFKDKDHKKRGEEIYAALEEQRITPTQAHILFATLCDNVKLTEMTEIVERIKKLEEAQKL